MFCVLHQRKGTEVNSQASDDYIGNVGCCHMAFRV